MKLSVSAFRAQASAQRKILSSYQSQLNYGTCTSFPALGGHEVDDKAQMMVDSTTIRPTNTIKLSQPLTSSGFSQQSNPPADAANMNGQQPTSDPVPSPPKRHPTTRSKSNQRWMKLRTTVQLSGAISNSSQKSKTPLKREDSFLKRFSTRQIAEAQETIDTGDETETQNGSQAQNEVNRRRRRRRKEMSRTVVNPDENFYFYWLMTITVCVLYNLWTLIVRQSFPELQKAANVFWFSGDAVTDIVFVCDIIVQFRTGYLEQGLMVYDSKKLATHYLKSRAFLLDTLSLLPLDFLQVNIGINPLLRFPRFLKVYRVYSYYYIVESRTVYPNLWRVVNLIHILLILAHWFGCFYYLLSEAEGFHGDWVYPHRPGDYATLTRKYLASLYWSTLTLTTIGDLPTPETNAESRGHSKAVTPPGQSEAIPRRGHKSRLLQFNSNSGYLFTIVSYLIGVFIFATIVGQVGNVITNRNANRLEFERLLDGAKTYMRHHKVPGGMKRRVLRWYDYSWSRGRIQGGGDINTALGLLPDKLKTELALHVNLSVLKKVTIFQECQPEFLHDLVLKMKAYIFTPGDLICRKGEVAREMFIIADGILDVISETGRVLTTMKAGDFFGEIGILNLDGLNKRTADVRSVGYSELFSLSREDVLSAMKDYPEAQEILQTLGRKRLMEAKNAAKVHKAQVRQSKDHDSSGESDTPGKRIVDKLRSDVRGIRKALRRSRRDTGTKGTLDRTAETPRGRTSASKHNVLRRMSHVQSSDECESGVEQEQSLIGAGLPLLQRYRPLASKALASAGKVALNEKCASRLKLLREKQENGGEEKEGLRKSGVAEGSPKKRGEVVGAEGRRAMEAGKWGLSGKSVRKSVCRRGKTVSGPGAVTSTVRTQMTGTQSDRSVGKSRSLGCPEGVEEGIRSKAKEEKSESEADGKAEVETSKSLLKGKPKSEAGLDEETRRSSVSESVNGARPSDTENPVPKVVRNAVEVPTSSNGWKLLKKCSISCSKSEGKVDSGEDAGVRKVSKRVTYLSKSDTILERQRSVQKDEEKRSRSVSPSKGSQEQTRPAEAGSMEEKTRLPGLGGFGGDLNALSDEYQPRRMKKYKSISDLSPEYSGLPFVKKLKILNERQKLEELEKELVVRSVSLDVSEGGRSKQAKVLVRSRSEASTGDCGGAVEAPGLQPAGDERERVTWRAECRRSIDEGRRYGRATWRCSEGSMASPESNETLERKHLKSILKKLSGEGSTSDEDRALKKFDGASSATELRRLMREPTMEGYVARHKKLTKSVTFDSETMSSPLEAVVEQLHGEYSSPGYHPPKSPTAILTLQLSNLSMMPIASPKKVNNSQEQKEGQTDACSESPHMQITTSSSIDDFIRKTPALPSNHCWDQFFDQIQAEILLIVRQLLEKAHRNFELQLNSLHKEVKERDQIILRLHSKLTDLEERYLRKQEGAGEGKGEVFGGKEESSEGGFDSSDAVVQGEGFGVGASGGESSEIGECFQRREYEDRVMGSWYEESSDHPFEVVHEREGGVSGEGKESVGESESSWRSGRKTGRGWGKEKEKERWKGKGKGKGSFINRLSKLQRSMSSCQEKKAEESVCLTIEESSNDSEAENLDGGDWEVEMLVEELGKKDPYWKVDEEREREAQGDLGHLDGVEKLREEVNTLKRVVCDSDLSRLTSSELDILESIIDAKDQKILQISKCNSLDGQTNSGTGKTGTSYGSAPEAEDGNNGSGRLNKAIKTKTGQALSFDFHDMESRNLKSPKTIKHTLSCAKIQKSTSASHRKHQSLYHLWRTSARLRNRVFDDSDKVTQGMTVSSSISATSRSSLPILVSTSPDLEKTSTLRTSLPLLSAKDFAPNFCECLTSPPTPSDDPPSPSDPHSSNTLNSFIKSVGQRVKQVVLGEINASRTQVPTISKLLEEQTSRSSPETEVLPRGIEGFSTSSSSTLPTATGSSVGSLDPDP